MVIHNTNKEIIQSQKREIYVKQPSLNRGDGLRDYLSLTYNAILSSLSRQLNKHPDLGSPNPNILHED